jgi:hypothetical protein
METSDLIEHDFMESIEPHRREGFLQPGQRVQIRGEQEVFTVLRIDSRRHLVDLLHSGALHKVEGGIPIFALRMLSEPRERESFQLEDRQRTSTGS